MTELDSYLPMEVRWALAQNAQLTDRAQGAVLFADIAGSTQLTITLARELGARRGAEELTRQIDHLFSTLISQIHRYHGSVTGISGDAITGWFAESSTLSAPGDATSGDTTSGDATTAAQRATAAALAIQAALAPLLARKTPVGTAFALGVKVTLVAGAVRRFVIGNPAIQRLECLAGATMDRVALAQQQAKPGEVLVGREIVDQLAGQLAIKSWRQAANGEPFAVASQLTVPVAPSPWPVLPPLPPSVVQPWLLPPVFQRLQAGHGAFLTELRPVVAFFLKFGGIAYDQDAAAGVKLTHYIAWVQTILARFEGYLMHVTIGDKGSYFNAAFGALVAHEDDAERAVAAAFALQRLPAELPFIQPVQIGIGQDLGFVGVYGSAERRTYGILGNEINLAARLMSLAHPGEILVTSRIAKATQHTYEFTLRDPILVKGVSEPVTPAVARGKRTQPDHGQLDRTAVPGLVGRQQELALLFMRLQALAAGASSSVVIEGEAGIGKSRLVEEALHQARTLAITCLAGAGDAIENASPYYAWRPIFDQLWSTVAPAAPTLTPDAVLAWLGLAPIWLPLLPLLNRVLPFELPESDLTVQMTGQVRADNTNRLLLEILQRQATTAPLCLVIEDLHWLDAASWDLLWRVQRVVQPLLLLLTTRPPTAPIPPVYQQLLRLPQAVQIRLNALTDDEVVALVTQRLGVAALPPAVAALIRSKAEGHPFFGEELAYSLRDNGYLLITPGHTPQEPAQCSLAPTVDIRTFNAPDTIQAVIAGRIDRLVAPQQTTLKVASVIGRVFTWKTLHAIHPIADDQPHLTGQLAELQQLGLTLLQTPEPDLTYLFKHVITQEVLYNLLLFAQRRQLHTAVAHWYERVHANDLTPFYQLLVHHWRQAEVLPRMVDYLDRAGTHALRRGIFAVARDHFTELLQLCDREPAITPESAQNRPWWIAKLGHAYSGLGQLTECRRYCEEAIAFFDRPAPANNLRAFGAFGVQLVRQLLHRWLPRWFIKPAPDEEARRRALEAAHLYRLLNTVYLFANEPLMNLYTSVRRLNVAEQAGQSGQLVEAYAVMGYVCSSLHGYPLAERYYAKARQTAAAVHEPLALAYALTASGMARLSIGQWAKIRTELTESIAIYFRLGAWQGWGDAMAALITAERMSGNLTRAQMLAEDLLQTARQNGNILHELWGAAARWVAVRRGEVARADSLLAELTVLLAQATEHIITVGLNSFRAEAALMQGKGTEAAHYVRHFLDQQAQAPLSTAIHAYESLVSALFVLITLLAAAPQQYQAAMQQLYKALRTYTFLFPVGQPALDLCRGWLAWSRGKTKAAAAAWRKSMVAAQRFAMPYEEGLAIYALGCYTAGPARAHHLTRAIALFEQSEAQYLLTLAQQAVVTLEQPQQA